MLKIVFRSRTAQFTAGAHGVTWHFAVKCAVNGEIGAPKSEENQGFQGTKGQIPDDEANRGLKPLKIKDS